MAVHYEWYPDDKIAIVHCPPDLNPTFLAQARKFIVGLESEPIDVVIDDAQVVEMPPNFIETASTVGVLAYPGVRRVAFCNIPSGWNLTLEAANKLATGKTDRVTFHKTVDEAFAHLQSLSKVAVKTTSPGTDGMAVADNVSDQTTH